MRYGLHAYTLMAASARQTAGVKINPKDILTSSHALDSCASPYLVLNFTLTPTQPIKQSTERHEQDPDGELRIL